MGWWPLTCIVLSDTHAGDFDALGCIRQRPEDGIPCQTQPPSTPTSSGERPSTTSSRRAADNGMPRRTGAEFQDREQMGAEPPARACRRARPEGREPRASRGEKAYTRARDGERLPEKSRGLPRQKPSVAARYRLMLAEKAEFPVKLMARLLGVSRSGLHSRLSNSCPREDWSAEREAVRRM